MLYLLNDTTEILRDYRDFEYGPDRWWKAQEESEQLQAEVTRLAADNAALRNDIAHLAGQVQDGINEQERLIETCREVLALTHHADDCMIYHGKTSYCSCQAEEMRKLLRAALASKDAANE